MRNAALMLGVIGGIIALIVGFFSYGYTEFVEWVGDDQKVFDQVENIWLVRVSSLLAPLLAIAGGAMSRSQAKTGGILMLVSAGLMLLGLNYNVFTMFPIAMCGLGGLLALVATKPDPH